jgi:hypothetical protein
LACALLFGELPVHFEAEAVSGPRDAIIAAEDGTPQIGDFVQITGAKNAGATVPETAPG